MLNFSALKGRLCGIWLEPPLSSAVKNSSVFRVKEMKAASVTGAIWVVPRNLRPIIGMEVFLWKRKGRTNHAVDWSERIKGKISLFF